MTGNEQDTSSPESSGSIEQQLKAFMDQSDKRLEMMEEWQKKQDANMVALVSQMGKQPLLEDQEKRTDLGLAQGETADVGSSVGGGYRSISSMTTPQFDPTNSYAFPFGAYGGNPHAYYSGYHQQSYYHTNHYPYQPSEFGWRLEPEKSPQMPSQIPTHNPVYTSSWSAASFQFSPSLYQSLEFVRTPSEFRIDGRLENNFSNSLVQQQKAMDGCIPMDFPIGEEISATIDMGSNFTRMVDTEKVAIYRGGASNEVQNHNPTCLSVGITANSVFHHEVCDPKTLNFGANISNNNDNISVNFDRGVELDENYSSTEVIVVSAQPSGLAMCSKMSSPDNTHQVFDNCSQGVEQISHEILISECDLEDYDSILDDNFNLDGEWEKIYNLICNDYETHLVHIDGDSDSESQEDEKLAKLNNNVVNSGTNYLEILEENNPLIGKGYPTLEEPLVSPLMCKGFESQILVERKRWIAVQLEEMEGEKRDKELTTRCVGPVRGEATHGCNNALRIEGCDIEDAKNLENIFSIGVGVKPITLNVERNVKIWDLPCGLTLFNENFGENKVAVFMDISLEKEFEVQQQLGLVKLGYSGEAQIATVDAEIRLLEMHDSSKFHDENQLAEFATNARLISLKVFMLMSNSDDAKKLFAVVFSLSFKLQPAITMIDKVESFLDQHSSISSEMVTSIKSNLIQWFS